MLEGLVFAAYVAAILCMCYAGWAALVAVLGRHRKLRVLKRLPSSDLCHWLLGHLYYFPGPTEEGMAFLRKELLRFPRLGLAYYGPWHYAVVLGHPEPIRALLKTSEPKPRWFGGYKASRPWLGDGLLISGGDKWARNRRLLTPAFHFDILKPYVAVKNKAVELLMTKLQSSADSGEYIELYSHISLCTLDIILRCAFSYDNDCQALGEQHPYVRAVNELGHTIIKRMLNPLLYPDWIFHLTSEGRQFKANCEFVHTISRDVITKRRKAIVAETRGVGDRKSRYLDFLDILLTAKDQEGVGLTDQEIQDEVDTFMFEGHDTTASGISWTLYELARHPQHMRKCQQEVDVILDGRIDDTIQWDDLGKFTHLTLCIKEALRLRSPVPLIERETTRETEVDGYTIPAGTIVDMPLYSVHHNPTVWEDSTEYRPERFLPENMDKMHPYAFIPFSAGPRNCIGQHFAMDEMKIIIARVIRRFNLEADPTRPARMLMAIVMRTEHGMIMKVKQRPSRCIRPVSK